MWVLAGAVAAITLPLLLWAGRSAPLAVALALTVALEMIIGTVILRGRNDCLPTLSAPRDLGRLLVAVASAAVVYDLVGASATYLLADSAEAWTRLVTSAPKHAAGMLLLVPLFMHLPKRPRQAGLVETIAQVVVTLGLVTFVFAFNPGMPLSFLPFMPLVWVAMRLTTRQLIVLMLAIAVIASVGSANNTGPFAFNLLAPDTWNLVLQVFELSMVVVFLSLSLAVGQERATAQRLNESEELFRRIFETSVAGMLIAARDATGWKVLRANDSAVAIIPGLADPSAQLPVLLGAEATAALSAEADALTEGNARLTLTTGAGRILNVSISPISDEGDT